MVKLNGSAGEIMKRCDGQASLSEIVNVRGPAGSSAIQLATRPTSLHVPSTSNPPGCSRACIADQASRTSVSSYWRSTFAARMTAGGVSVGISKPPSRKVTPSRAAAAASRTRWGSISMPTTRTSGRTRASRSRSSSVVVAEAP